MSHADPSEKETFIKKDSFLEIFSRNFIFFTMEVISTHREPWNRMWTVILDQIMGTVVELPS